VSALPQQLRGDRTELFGDEAGEGEGAGGIEVRAVGAFLGGRVESFDGGGAEVLAEGDAARVKIDDGNVFLLRDAADGGGVRVEGVGELGRVFRIEGAATEGRDENRLGVDGADVVDEAARFSA